MIPTVSFTELAQIFLFGFLVGFGIGWLTLILIMRYNRKNRNK